MLFLGWQSGTVWGSDFLAETWNGGANQADPQREEHSKQEEQQVGGPRGRPRLGELREHQGDQCSKMPLLGKGSQLWLLPLLHPYISSINSCWHTSKIYHELMYVFFVHVHSNPSPIHLFLLGLLQESNWPPINSNHVSPLLKILPEFLIALWKQSNLLTMAFMTLRDLVPASLSGPISWQAGLQPQGAVY